MIMIQAASYPFCPHATTGTTPSACCHAMGKVVKCLVIAIALLFLASCQSPSPVASPFYHNPIIKADLSDPDVVRVGEDYYMTVSSFNMVPGLPIYHSKDLVHWSIVGSALDAIPKAKFTYSGRSESELDYDAPRPSKGVWAPSIHYHDDYFWIFWGDPDAGVYRVRSKDPRGPWEKPVLVKEAHGWIDPAVLWDDDSGKAFLVHALAKSRANINARLQVWEMNKDATELIGEPTVIYDAYKPHKFPSDREHRIIEGPKFYKMNGWYYVLAPAGGVESGWQTALRSRKPFGPYEIKTVCETGDTNINGPHQGALLKSHNDRWWFLHFQSAGTLGRISRLEPVHWRDNWPIIGIDSDGDGIGEPVTRFPYPLPPVPKYIQTSDDFNGDSLGLQWQWPANPKANWYQLTRGHIFLPALYSAELAPEKLPNVLNQMFPDFNFSATSAMELNGQAGIRGGLLTLGRKVFQIDAEQKNRKQIKLSVRFDNEVLEETAIPSGRFWLRLKTRGELPLPLKRKPNMSPEKKTTLKESDVPHEVLDLDRWENGKIFGRFFYSLDGKHFKQLGGEYIIRSGWWSGARVGMFSVKTQADAKGGLLVDSFVVEK